MVSWTVTVSRMTMVFVTEGGSGRVSETGTLVGSVCRDAINRVSTILHACTLGDGLQRQRGKIRLLTQIVDAMVHGDARQPRLEPPECLVCVRLFDGLQECLMRQILGRLSVVHIPIAHSDHLLNVLVILPFPKLCFVHLRCYYIMTQK